MSFPIGVRAEPQPKTHFGIFWVTEHFWQTENAIFAQYNVQNWYICVEINDVVNKCGWQKWGLPEKKLGELLFLWPPKGTSLHETTSFDELSIKSVRRPTGSVLEEPPKQAEWTLNLIGKFAYVGTKFPHRIVVKFCIAVDIREVGLPVTHEILVTIGSRVFGWRGRISSFSIDFRLRSYNPPLGKLNV